MTQVSGIQQAVAKQSIGVGVIGAGYMGKAYSIALNSVNAVFPLVANARLEMLATLPGEDAEGKAAAWGYQRYTRDWRDLVSDSRVDVVAVCTPTFMHQEMAMAAIAAGKHVICEKPLALAAKSAWQMATAAEKAGVCNLVGYNYSKNPAAQLAKQMIEAGELGDIISFRGTHIEDFLADPAITMSWRLEEKHASRAGALGDLASHIINLAHYLCGPIASVVGDRQVVHSQRSGTDGQLHAVENDDQASFLLRFASGVMGSIEASRVALGRKMGLCFEVVGSRGSLCFTQERMAELQFYSADDRSGRSGFRTILIGTRHPDYANFCLGDGHGIGYNDMIAIEMRDMLEAVSNACPLWPTFRDACHTADVVEAVLHSCDSGHWQAVQSPTPVKS
jgi:prepilin-type processing-associated H-X9-DG protein